MPVDNDDRSTLVKINMLNTVKGASDQIRVYQYEEGNEYEVSLVLAQALIENGDAEFSNSEDSKNYKFKVKNKNAPQNKALDSDDYLNKSDANKSANGKAKGEK